MVFLVEEAIMKSINLLTMIVSLSMLIVTGGAGAAIIQDQSSGGPAGFTFTRCLGCSGSIFDIAQTFTVGQSGILAQVDIYNVYLNLSNDGSSTGNPLLFDIRNTTSVGLPVADNSLALAILEMPASSMPTSAFSPPMVFDLLSFGLNVNAGDVLALVLRSNDNVFAFGTSAGNAYSGGQYTQRFSANAEFPDFVAPSFPDGTDLSFRTYVDISPVIATVTIDIKPGSDPNSVNPRSQGVVPVAVLGSIDFDATQVDFLTVRFGIAEASPAHDGHVEDVNDDGFMDMVFHFKTQETGIVCGDTEATLVGEISDGTPITGTDTVNTVGCKGTISEKSTSSKGAGAMSGMLLIGLGVLGLWRLNRRTIRPS
jgi:hypothetical protein